MAVGRRTLEVARSEGVRGLWWRGLGVTVYRRLMIVTRKLDAGGWPPPPKISVTAELLDQATADDYLALRRDVKPLEVQRRLATGQRCVLARRAGKPVGALWFASERAELPYLDLTFYLVDGIGYVYDVYTAPDLRGAGVSSALRPHYLEGLRAEGCHTLLGTTMPENVSGRGLIGAAGYDAVGTVGCFRLGPLRVPVRRLPTGYLGQACRLRT
jgi:GNAT superfamily N-acetyltransferase